MKQIQQKIDEELKKIKDLPVLPKVEDENTICLGNEGMYDNTDVMASTYKLDDWIIQPLDFGNLAPLLNTVSLSGTGASGTYALGGTGPSGLSYSNTNYTFHSTNGASGQYSNPGIHLPEDGDITIGERSLMKTLDKIEQRLSILVPNPKKLKRYEALQQAYEHYKTLEALCNEEPKQDSK